MTIETQYAVREIEGPKTRDQRFIAQAEEAEARARIVRDSLIARG